MADALAGLLAGIFSLYIEKVINRMKEENQPTPEEQYDTLITQEKKYLEKYQKAANDLKKLQETHADLVKNK